MNASERADAERARLHEIMAVSAVEGTVTGARMAELKAAQEAAWRRHRAAKGLLTRARKDGSAAKIAAAAERERQAYAQADATAREAIEEMLALNRARLDAHGELLGQVGRTWAADAEALDEIARPEAGP
jgi:hypothetical protein